MVGSTNLGGSCPSGQFNVSGSYNTHMLNRPGKEDLFTLWHVSTVSLGHQWHCQPLRPAGCADRRGMLGPVRLAPRAARIRFLQSLQR